MNLVLLPHGHSYTYLGFPRCIVLGRHRNHQLLKSIQHGVSCKFELRLLSRQLHHQKSRFELCFGFVTCFLSISRRVQLIKNCHRDLHPEHLPKKQNVFLLYGQIRSASSGELRRLKGRDSFIIISYPFWTKIGSSLNICQPILANPADRLQDGPIHIQESGQYCFVDLSKS